MITNPAAFKCYAKPCDLVQDALHAVSLAKPQTFLDAVEVASALLHFATHNSDYARRRNSIRQMCGHFGLVFSTSDSFSAAESNELVELVRIADELTWRIEHLLN